MLLSCLIQAFADLRLKRLFWLSVLSLVLSLLVISGVSLGVGFAFDSLKLVHAAWLDTILSILSGLGILVAGILFFPALTAAMAGLFVDWVADAVERKHYTQFLPAHGSSWKQQLKSALRLAALMIVLNILALPLLFIFAPLSYVLNGYLLGREYWQGVALRHLSSADKLYPLRRRFRFTIFFAGLVIAVLSTIPVINLIAPVLATSFMTHVFFRTSREML